MSTKRISGKKNSGKKLGYVNLVCISPFLLPSDEKYYN